MTRTAWIFSYKLKKNVSDEDFVLWESEDDANNATTIGQGKEVTKDFYACIQMNTCRALISQFVKKY